MKDLFLITQIDPYVDQTIIDKNPGVEQEITYRRPLFIRREYSFVDDDKNQSTRGPSRRQGFKLALWSWLSLLTDGLVIVAAGCFFNLVFMFTVQQFFKADLGFLYLKSNRALSFSCVFIFTGWIYFIATRALVGASVGEWTCSLRLGQPSERLSDTYITRLLIRTTVGVLTGIILLPLMSLFFKKDISGFISGLKLYSLK